MSWDAEEKDGKRENPADSGFEQRQAVGKKKISLWSSWRLRKKSVHREREREREGGRKGGRDDDDEDHDHGDVSFNEDNQTPIILHNWSCGDWAVTFILFYFYLTSSSVIRSPLTTFCFSHQHSHFHQSLRGKVLPHYVQGSLFTKLSDL